MAPINTKKVHCTNALRGHPWGRDFVDDERVFSGDGAMGQRRARAMARNGSMQDALLRFAPARALLRRFVLPKPGEGPSAHERGDGPGPGAPPAGAGGSAVLERPRPGRPMNCANRAWFTAAEAIADTWTSACAAG
jgi:hypothetical protein